MQRSKQSGSAHRHCFGEGTALRSPCSAEQRDGLPDRQGKEEEVGR